MYLHCTDNQTQFYPREYTAPDQLVIGDKNAGKVYQLERALIKRIEPVGPTSVCINYEGLMIMIDVADSRMVAKYLNGFLLKKFSYCPN